MWFVSGQRVIVIVVRWHGCCVIFREVMKASGKQSRAAQGVSSTLPQSKPSMGICVFPSCAA